MALLIVAMESGVAALAMVEPEAGAAPAAPPAPAAPAAPPAGSPAPIPGGKAARVHHLPHRPWSLCRTLGAFEAGDTLIARVRARGTGASRVSIMLGDLDRPGAEKGVGEKRLGADWQTLMVVHRMSQPGVMKLYLCGRDMDGVDSCSMFDDVEVTSARRGRVLADGFEGGLAAWTRSGQPVDLINAVPCQPAAGSATGAPPAAGHGYMRELGTFAAGDRVTATAWVSVESDNQAELFLGRADELPPLAETKDCEVLNEPTARGEATRSASIWPSGGWKMLTCTHIVPRDGAVKVGLRMRRLISMDAVSSGQVMVTSQLKDLVLLDDMLIISPWLGPAF